jgi:hypothetical protein
MNENKDIIKKTEERIFEIEGKVLVDFIVHIVEPEINIAYMVFTDSICAVNGAIGSEIITINKVIDNNLLFEKIQLRRFEPYSMFYNRKIIQIRVIGNEWNGHGFEINFEGICNNSMILQSIYAGDKPSGFEDCIKLGIGNYYYSSDNLQMISHEYSLPEKREVAKNLIEYALSSQGGILKGDTIIFRKNNI